MVHKPGREHRGPDHPVRRDPTVPATRSDAEPTGIACGSDGRLWFTEAGVSRIASIGTTVPEAKLNSRVLTFAAGSALTRKLTVTNTGDAALAIAGVKHGPPHDVRRNRQRSR